MFFLKVSAATSVLAADSFAPDKCCSLPVPRHPVKSAKSAKPMQPAQHGLGSERSANKVLQYLKSKGHLFDGSIPSKSTAEDAVNKLSTGYSELDMILEGGLSSGQLHEVQALQAFSGESRILRAPLAYADEHQSPVFWVNPPAMPSLHGMQCAHHIAVSNQTSNPSALPKRSVISKSHAPHQLQIQQTSHYYLQGLDARQLQWSVLQILHSVERAVVLIWHPQPNVQMVRSWQRAIQKVPQTFALVFSDVMPPEARAYQTRIRLNMQSSYLSFEVLKRQGGWPTQTQPEPLAV